MTAPWIEKLLREHAAVRRRVADEHTVTVTYENGRPMGTFRLQLFTAPGARPVAIATQTTAEGAGLTNRTEKYAAAVWRRYLPHDAEPPVWIQLQLLGNPSRPDRFTLVTFDQAGPYELAGPRWCRMDDAETERLVGEPVDRGRGEGYRPWPVPPEEQWSSRSGPPGGRLLHLSRPGQAARTGALATVLLFTVRARPS